MSTRARQGWALAITSLALFMVVLDNLVVTTALPVMKEDLDASVDSLGWIVNAYTLSFAVLLLTGAALGDRLGRRPVFSAGIAVFALASAGCAMATSFDALVLFRVLQGAGAALVLPLSLTLLSDAFPPGKRGLAIGIWSGISGLAVACGPLVGGAVVDGLSWHWIFWPNVPLGAVCAVLALRYLANGTGPDRHLDIPGLVLAGVGLFGLVWGVVRGNEAGWTSLEIVGALATSAVFLAAFVAWQRRTGTPMLPLHMYRSRGFTVANAVSGTMYFGMFGAVFFLAQFLQVSQGYTPFEAGLRTLPWTVMPMFVAPLAGALSDRIGFRPLLVTGMVGLAGSLVWQALIARPDLPYSHLVLPQMLAGVGMSLVFAPVANLLVASVREKDIGKASGANNMTREVGGAIGIAVLTAMFTRSGSYATPEAFVDGMRPAVLVAAVVVVVGAFIAMWAPAARRAQATVVEPATAQ